MSEPTNKPRILHIHASAILGGTELRAFQIASRLKDQFKLTVLFHCAPGAICDAYAQAGIPFWVVPFPEIVPALKVIRECKPDVIHIYGLKTNLLWRVILYAMGYRNMIGHIAGLTNLGEQPSWARVFMDRLTHRLLRIYLSNSQTVADDLVRRGFNPSKLRVIRNGVVIPPSLTKSTQGTIPVIVSVGALREVKGQRILLEALRSLKNQNVAFEAWIVGQGPDRSALEALARTYDLSSNVRFYGEVANADLQALLQKADIFALLSLSEGISGATMEAMATGLPVVVSNVGGMSELVEDSVEGFLVPLRNATMAADRLQQLLIQSTLRQQMGTKARLKILTQFSIDRAVADYKHLYTSVCLPS